MQSHVISQPAMSLLNVVLKYEYTAVEELREVKFECPSKCCEG